MARYAAGDDRVPICQEPLLVLGAEHHFKRQQRQQRGLYIYYKIVPPIGGWISLAIRDPYPSRLPEM